jgi:hypothetical protein
VTNKRGTQQNKRHEKTKKFPVEAEDKNVLDEAEKDETVPAVHYEITSFGADF